MKFFFRIFFVLSFGVGGYFVNAQDVHYSQMYSTPLYVNPAFTGNHDADFRTGINYRQQDAKFKIPFTTYTAWGDTRVYPNFLRRRAWIGLGAHLYYDNAGFGDLTKVQGMFFAAFSQGFNSDNSFYGSLGVGIGVTNRTINKDKLIFEDQWNDTTLEFNLGIKSADLSYITNSSIFYPDFNLGIAVHHLVNEKWMYEVGGSISHINKPKESFFGESGNNNKVGRKYIGHFTVQRILSQNVLIKPEFYFITQEGVSQTLFGANLVFGAEGIKLYTGLWYRLGRDLIPTVGIEYNDYTLLFSYDVNVSKKHIASDYQGGFEFSLVKKFRTKKISKRKPCKFLQF